jgi:hypothetical protein
MSRIVDSWGLVWKNLRQELRPNCDARNCAYAGTGWRRVRVRPSSIRMQGSQYCLPECLEQVLQERLQKAASGEQPKPAGHRIPLGLLLLSKQHLTGEQLRRALAAQRTAGRGRLGDWLQELGFVSERQVTAALARQWSCPVLQTASAPLNPVLCPEIPMLLLDLFHMVPVSFVAATATLHMAFAEGIDYAVLYAIEQMFDCRTHPCVVDPSLLRESLLALGTSRRAREVVFDRVSDVAELVRIVSNYATRASARAIRLASCRQYSWVRLECALDQSLSLLLRMPASPVLRPSLPGPGTPSAS